MVIGDTQLDEMERQERARHSSNGYTYPDHYGFVNGTWPKLLEQAREANRLRAQNAALREALEAARGEITRMAEDGGGFSCAVVDEIDAVLAAAGTTT